MVADSAPVFHFNAYLDPTFHFNADRIRNPHLIKVMRIRDHWFSDPQELHFEPPRLHCERPRPSTAPFILSL
jgi:hypothetical protein